MVLNLSRSDSRRYKLLFISLSVFLLLLSFTSNAQGQRSDTPPLGERLFYGGSFGLQFGTYTDIEFSPVIGLWVLPRLAIAVGPKYRFYKDPVNRTNIYGARVYSDFVLIKDIGAILPVKINMGIFFHAEDELLSLESSFWKNPPFTSDRFYTNTILAGGGISQPMGRRSSMNLIVMWALNEPLYGIYSNPEIRVSFVF